MDNQYPQQQQQNMKQIGSGLARYRSAPSSFWDTILSGSVDDDDVGFGTEGFDQLFDTPRASTPDQTHRIFSKFASSSTSSEAVQENLPSSNTSSSNFQTQSQQPNSQSTIVQQQQLQRQKSVTDYSTMMMYADSENNNNNSYNSNQIKMEGSFGNSGGGLIRHSSSPAGFFANLDIQKEFGAMRSMDNSGPGNTSNAEGSFSSAITFKRHIDFSSKTSSSSGLMAPISKIGKKRSGENNPGQGDGHFVEDRSHNGGNYVPGFSTNSWNNSQMLSDDFFEGLVENNDETFTNANILDTKNNEGGKRPAALLSHRHSLPASSAEFFAMENLLEDSVPCKIRAKRGFATHPRSIAERVRRTNISNRIKKLQDLVPNMDKQTNTADMLDLAVDYIKYLQREVKKLSDNDAKCTCMAKEKS